MRVDFYSLIEYFLPHLRYNKRLLKPDTVMKIKGLLLATLSLLGISGALAQVEYDDMYFNKEDRAKLNAQRSTEVAYNTPSKKKFADEEVEDVNPTDSYSARNVNPEYTSRAHTETAQSDEADYFVNNYQYNRNQLNNWNNDFGNWYNSPLYRNNYYGPMINSWNSPYYGYNSWNSPWFDPFWSYNGWSSSFSYHMGSRWNYGWGGNYNYWNRPYYGWDPYFGGMGMGPYAGMGMGPYGGMGMMGMGMGYYGGGFGGGYWNNYRYPGTVVVVNPDNGGRNVVYGKRPSRGTVMVSDRSNVRSRSSVNNSVRDDNSSGRVTSQGRKQAEYYNRSTRTQRSSGNATYDNRSNTQYNRSRSYDSWDNSSYDNNRSMNRSSSPSYSPSRSSSSGAGTRTNTSSGSSGRRGRD